MTESGARILVADPDEIVRAGLKAVLAELSLVRVVGSVLPSDAVAACRSLQPDMVLVDAVGRGRVDTALVGDVRRASPRTAVMVFTQHDDPHLVLEAIGAGARAYLRKGSPAELLATAIDRVLAGEAFVDPVIAGRVIGALAAAGRAGTAPRPDPLTDRERDVLREVARGRSNKEIAGSLDLAAGTVKIHVEHILRKLMASNRAEATTRAFELGILELDEDERRAAAGSGRAPLGVSPD